MPSTTPKRTRRTRSSGHPVTKSPGHPVTQPRVITIDGPAGSGKSTVAKLLAKVLGLTYLDTGATYRALAYAVLQEQPGAIADPARLAAMARALPLRLEPRRDGTIRIFLDGVEITRAIRTQEVSEAAAQISQYPDVRAAMVERQRGLAGLPAAPTSRTRRAAQAGGRGVVVEGRDTGSVVFPHAAYKFFLDADLSIRAERRQRELLKLYGEPTPLAQIREEMHFRDSLDRYRQVGPLVKPKGAVAIDTTHLTTQEVVQHMLRRIRGGR